MSTAETTTVVRPPLLTSREVDEEVNAVFTALTNDLGRPFTAGRRNVRRIVQGWCPLTQGLPSLDVAAFRRAYITAHFYDRYFYHDELRNKRGLEDQALEKFQDNLSRGESMNRLFRENLLSKKLISVLWEANWMIGRILGEFDVEELFDRCTHGPNSTIGVLKENAYLDRKIKATDGTLPALMLLRDYLDWNEDLSEYYLRSLPDGETHKEFTVCEGNRLSFVPKKFDSLRTMMVEPTINQFFQQGLGAMIQRRLFGAGIDLSTQPECHARLTKVITRHNLPMATIDWSQASDRIWLELCRRLLPSDWFAALEIVRSPATTYSCGKASLQMELTMAGSMGTGFIFPLQTLVFYCLLRALSRVSGIGSEFVTVFGDDCICDSDLLPEVEWLAGELDWKLNTSKSFSSGDFRESCGTDAYRGEDCRPFFIERPNDVTSKAALAAWAYSVFNQCHEATKLPWFGDSLSDWLVTFLLDKLGLRNVFYVPPRYSVTTGVRVKSPLDHLANAPTLVEGSSATGYKFQSICNRRVLVSVDPEPFYLWSLMGKGVPSEFRRAKTVGDEDVTSYVPDQESRVPWKGVAYGTKERYVHTWHYFSDI